MDNRSGSFCKKRRSWTMAFTDPVFYTILKLDGDYAWLRKAADPTAEPIMVARSLLPDEITEGCKVKRVMFDYSMD
jgi:hypothetical protein